MNRPPSLRQSSDRPGRRRAAALPDRRGEVGRVQPDGGDGVAVWIPETPATSPPVGSNWTNALHKAFLRGPHGARPRCRAMRDFRPGTAVEFESDAHLLAIDTKVAFTIRACFSALVKVTDMATGALIWLYHNDAIDGNQAWNGLLQVCAPQNARSGANSSGDLSARWIAIWLVRSLAH
jgi:hypothetical protein